MLNKLKRAWSIYANFSGGLVISACLAYAILVTFSENGPVMEVVPDQQGRLVRDITEKVPYRGTVGYTFDVKRYDSCPGFVVVNLTSRTNHGPPAVVTFRRPVRNTEIKQYDSTRANVILPESVFPGKWSLQSSVDSRCPTYERSDVLVTFEFEVIAP